MYVPRLLVAKESGLNNYFQDIKLSQSGCYGEYDLDYHVIGYSFMNSKGGVEQKSVVEIDEFIPGKLVVVKAILYWSFIQVGDLGKKQRQVYLSVPGKNRQKVGTGKVLKQHSDGLRRFLMKKELNLSSIENGEIEVELLTDDLRDKIIKNSAWAMVVVFKDKNEVIKKKKDILIFDGILPMMETRQYSKIVDLNRNSIAADDRVDIKLTYVGEGGFRGNGTTNFYKNQPITGYENWVGNAGEKWDIMTHHFTSTLDETLQLKFDVETTYSKMTMMVMVIKTSKSRNENE